MTASPGLRAPVWLSALWACSVAVETLLVRLLSLLCACVVALETGSETVLRSNNGYTVRKLQELINVR